VTNKLKVELGEGDECAQNSYAFVKTNYSLHLLEYPPEAYIVD